MPELSKLIRAVQADEAGAMEALVLRYSGPIRHECYKIGLGNYTDLSYSDLMQEVLMQVWKNIQKFRGGDDEEQTERAFMSWLRKNAKTALSNLCRNRNAQKRRPADGLQSFDDAAQNYGNYRPVESGVSSVFFRHEDEARTRHAIDTYLDEQSRHIVLRHIEDDKSFKDIAEELSLTYDQVRYIFHCAQSRLAKWLA